MRVASGHLCTIPAPLLQLAVYPPSTPDEEFEKSKVVTADELNPELEHTQHQAPSAPPPSVAGVQAPPSANAGVRAEPGSYAAAWLLLCGPGHGQIPPHLTCHSHCSLASHCPCCICSGTHTSLQGPFPANRPELLQAALRPHSRFSLIPSLPRSLSKVPIPTLQLGPS